MCHSAYLWGSLIKNKGGVRLFQISQKERLFHVSYQSSYNLAMWSLFIAPIAPFQKRPVFPVLSCQSAPCSYRQSRNRIGWWAFIIVNITSLEDKSMLLVPSKRPSLSLYWGTHLKEQLTDYCLILKVTRIFPIPTQVK